ncbi:unnamed protein product, partial [Prorocentrum cordatum]
PALAGRRAREARARRSPGEHAAGRAGGRRRRGVLGRGVLWLRQRGPAVGRGRRRPGEPADDGSLDDLEYLSLDLANLLPTESLLPLLEILRAREGKACQLSRENERLREEVGRLRSKVCAERSRRTEAAAAARGRPPRAADAEEAFHDAEPRVTAAEQADLERRVAAFVAERRGEAAVGGGDALSEDLQEAATETLEFLQDLRQGERCGATAPASGHADPVARLEHPRGAGAGTGRLAAAGQGAGGHPVARALAGAGDLGGELAGLRASAASAFGELPECAPRALQAIQASSSSTHAHRVGMACLALATFAATGREAVLEERGRGWLAVLQAAKIRQRHPEVQAWALAVLANCSPDLPRDGGGADLAWQGVAACWAAARAIPNARAVLERAAHALAALLNAHPRRAGAAARAKGLLPNLREAAVAFAPALEANWPLHRRLAEAESAFKRAEAAAGTVAAAELSPRGEREHGGCDREPATRLAP